MEYNNLNRENGGDPESMDIKVVVEKFISRWRWFAVSIPLCLLIAFLVCQSRVPVYNVTGKVMISDSKKGELGSNVMMKELGLSDKKHTTDDMLFTVETVSCLGACGLAPTCTVNDEVHPNMTPEKVVGLITELRGEC